MFVMLVRQLFLDRYDIACRDVHFLAQDMSPRRYHRIKNKNLLLMEGPSDVLAAYHHIGGVLLNLGARVPRIVALEEGHALIDDWGDKTLTNLISGHHDVEALYHQAVHVLVRLHKACKEQRHVCDDLNPYDAATMVEEAALFPVWSSSSQPSEEALQEYKEIWSSLHALCPVTPYVLVLRDYHVDNIMLTPHGDLGILDFQDALWGPCIYDLTSLLEDARVDVAANIVSSCLELYSASMAITPDAWKEYRLAYDVWGLGRHLKILGVFNRYAKKFNNPSKLIHLPRVWKHVNRILENPLFLDLKHWMEKNDLKGSL